MQSKANLDGGVATKPVIFAEATRFSSYLASMKTVKHEDFSSIVVAIFDGNTISTVCISKVY